MAAIPCTDFLEDAAAWVPARIKRTNPDALRDRWGNFVYSMDLSPLQDDDDLGSQYGAWSLWDIPTSHCAQWIDDRGTDLVVVAVLNRVYILDWNRNADEWMHNMWSPIYKMILIGPIPSSKDDAPKGYALDVLKRFREFQFTNTERPRTGAASKWRISVSEWSRYDGYKITMRAATQNMRIPMAKKGRAFMVRLEHSADEPIKIEHYQAKWDMLSPRMRNSRRTQ